MSYPENPDMGRYYVMTIRDRKTERVFEYVYPGTTAEMVREFVQALYGAGFEVGEAVQYRGNGAKVNRTPG